MAIFALVLTVTLPASGTLTVEDISTSRESPLAGERFEVRCLIRSVNGTGPDLVEVRAGDLKATMYPSTDAIDWTQGVAYEGRIALDKPGNYTLTITVSTGEGTLTFFHDLTVVENEGRAEGETILGLPRWYCALSVVIFTIFIMFLTFAYFKGRSIHRERSSDNVKTREFCSSCGSPLSPEDTACPSCRKELKGRVEVCGMCRSAVPSGSPRCPSCGTHLTDPGKA
jgi:hypothetical protein